MEVTPAASDSGHVKWSFFIRASNICNRVFGTLPSSDFSFLWKFYSFFRQPKRRVCLPLPLPHSSRDSSICRVNAEASQVFDILRDIIENMFFNLHNIQKNLQFWQSRAEGSGARKMYFMICERGPQAFFHGTMQFLSESLAKDSSAHHLSHSASAYISQRITVLSILRTSVAAFLAKVYLEVERSGEEIVRDPKKSVPSLLVAINGLFSKLEDAISHLQSNNLNYSSVDGSNSLPPIFQKLPEVNRRGSQWTDCELQDAINLVYQNLQQLNVYLSDIVAKHQKPRKVTLYWLRYTCGAAGLSLCSFWLLRHSSLMGSSDIDNWIQEARSSTISFFNDHVEQPLLAIRDELFDTFRKRHKGMMELEEVQLTSNSLHRMLLAFTEQTKGQKIPENASDQAMLEIVMARYEKELTHPIQNLLSGELARALLIQVQKLKLDIETAMLELDQILKANEINFAILAALPAFFLSLLLLMLVRAWFKQDSKAEGRGRIARIQRRLLVVEVEKKIIQYQTYMDQGLEKDAECMFGLLLYSLDRLYHAVERHAKDTGEWQCLRQDIVDLAKPGLQTTYKLVVTSRMDRVYDCLLPSLKRQ